MEHCCRKYFRQTESKLREWKVPAGGMSAGTFFNDLGNMGISFFFAKPIKLTKNNKGN